VKKVITTLTSVYQNVRQFDITAY